MNCPKCNSRDLRIECSAVYALEEDGEIGRRVSDFLMCDRGVLLCSDCEHEFSRLD